MLIWTTVTYFNSPALVFKGVILSKGSRGISVLWFDSGIVVSGAVVGCLTWVISGVGGGGGGVVVSDTIIWVVLGLVGGGGGIVIIVSGIVFGTSIWVVSGVWVGGVVFTGSFGWVIGSTFSGLGLGFFFY